MVLTGIRRLVIQIKAIDLYKRKLSAQIDADNLRLLSGLVVGSQVRTIIVEARFRANGSGCVLDCC